MRWLSLLVASLLAAACVPEPSTDGGSGEAVVAPRPSAFLLWDGPVTSWEPGEHFPGFEPEVRSRPQDVTIDGDRIVISLGVYGSGCAQASPTLLVSEDRGATWTVHSLPALGGYQTDEEKLANCAPPVHAGGGKVAVLLTDIDDLGNPRRTPVLVDLVYDEYRASGGVLFACEPWGAGAYWLCYDCQNNSGHYVYYDLASGLTSQASPFACASRVVSTWGGEFVSFGGGSNAEIGVGASVFCRSASSLWSPVETSCVPGGLWPAWARPDGVPRPTNRGPVWMANGDGRAWATDISPPAASGELPTPVLFDLGPGNTRTDALPPHPRFGNLLRVEQPGLPVRFVDLLADGTVETVALPTSPCELYDGCGKELEHVWVLPLGGDDFLSLYLVDTFEFWADSAHHNQLWGSIDHAVRAPPAFPPAPDHGDLATPGFPTATEVSALEKACYRVRKCYPSWTVDACVTEWMRLRTSAPATDPAYEAFVATTDCAGFQTTWPVVRTSGTPTCWGDVITRSSAGFDCGRLGAHCQQVSPGVATCGSGVVTGSCVDSCAGGYAINCGGTSGAIAADCAAMGGSCVAGTSTVMGLGTVHHYCSAGACTPGVARQCDGDVAFTCTVDGQKVNLDDCSRIGGSCVAGACVGAGSDCSTNASYSQCAGPYLLQCRYDKWRYYDCRETGFGSCKASGTSVNCVP
jgi:hypothetical protein